MKDIGRMIKLLEKEDSFMLTETFTKDNGKKTKQMVMEYILTKMELCIKVIGWKINNTEKVRKHGLMEQNIQVITSMERKTVEGIFSGLTTPDLKENSRITIFKGSALIRGLMDGNTQGCGSTTKWMGKEYLHGLMEGSMKESTLKIKNTGTVFLFGQMADNILEGGEMVSSTVKEHM
jgi:hypothetical protein